MNRLSSSHCRQGWYLGSCVLMHHATSTVRPGERYNKKNSSHLLSQLRFRHMLGRSISLTDCLRKELERLIPTFAYVELAPEKMPSSEKTLSVVYETCHEALQSWGDGSATCP